MGRGAMVEQGRVGRARASAASLLVPALLIAALLVPRPAGAEPAGATETTDATQRVLEGIGRHDRHAGRIVGRVAYVTGVAAPGLVVELADRADGPTAGSVIGSQVTRRDGSFRFDVRPGCYSVTVMAPLGDRIVDGATVGTYEVCVDAGRSPAVVRVFLEGEAPRTSTLSATEFELLRLTNLLRADPSGPLGRERVLPSCVNDPFYRIAIDRSTGAPEPAPPLEMSEMTANALARAWAIELAITGEFRHRPSAAQQQILASLDLPVTAWGENIAWFNGYPPEDTATIHFEGWRESETSHYCALISPRFTHVGIGELRIGDDSWAVQNFYAMGSG